MKTYSEPSADLLGCITRMQSEHHPDLNGVEVGALFVFDAESSDSVLKHHGYLAAAVVRITPLRDRALGVADALIVVDRACWATLKGPQRDALIDHELTHLAPVLEEETGQLMLDALDRPRLAMRRHDHQLGWFDDVARRHGEASPELMQAKQLVEGTRQLYFDFGPKQLPLPQPGPGFAAAAAARASAPPPDSAPAKQPADVASAMPVNSGEGEGGSEPASASAPPSAAVVSESPPPGYDQPTTITDRDTGATTQLRSAKQIDDEMQARAAAKNGDAKFADDIGPKTRAELEKAKNRRGPRPIDGRSSH